MAGGQRWLAILVVAATAGTEHQYGCQSDPAAHGMHHDRAGEVMKFCAEICFQPGLECPSCLIPGDAFETGGR
jgi:hypothetical protein